jgi:crotonobetainyl-CoA:carnitine CoA-transferase CaiB-like acyl-CoA transferase
LLPGPYCTRILADLGADVVKVEGPDGGDSLRHFPGIPRRASDAWFAWLNGAKRCIRLDLKSPAGKRAFEALVTQFDVVVESFRPGVMERLGLGFDDLRRLNRRLIMCRISGYGQAGPYRLRAGHDLNYLALSGVASRIVGSAAVPVVPGIQIADVAGGGQAAAIQILASLVERSVTRRGRELDVSMAQSVAALLAPPTEMASALDGGRPCYGYYRCRDGWMSVAALEPRFWRNFLSAIGRPDLESKARVTGRESRETRTAIEKVLQSKTRKEWMRALDGIDACCEPVLSPREAEQPPGSRRLSPTSLDLTSPGYGEHTREVLQEAGIAQNIIDTILWDAEENDSRRGGKRPASGT